MLANLHDIECMISRAGGGFINQGMVLVHLETWLRNGALVCMHGDEFEAQG